VFSDVAVYLVFLVPVPETDFRGVVQRCQKVVEEKMLEWANASLNSQQKLNYDYPTTQSQET
jgi:hypothetical protein